MSKADIVEPQKPLFPTLKAADDPEWRKLDKNVKGHYTKLVEYLVDIGQAFEHNRYAIKEVARCLDDLDRLRDSMKDAESVMDFQAVTSLSSRVLTTSSKVISHLDRMGLSPNRPKVEKTKRPGYNASDPDATRGGQGDRGIGNLAKAALSKQGRKPKKPTLEGSDQ